MNDARRSVGDRAALLVGHLLDGACDRACVVTSRYNPHGLMSGSHKCSAEI
jgi:hypothetical protein